MRVASMLLISLALALGATAAGASSPEGCAPGLHSAPTAEIFFSRGSGPGREVGDDDWRAFFAEEISPRFPEGLGVLVSDVYGRRPDADRRFVREPSKALILVMSGAPAERRTLSLIREAYRRRFHQASALVVERGGCVSF